MLAQILKAEMMLGLVQQLAQTWGPLTVAPMMIALSPCPGKGRRGPLDPEVDGTDLDVLSLVSFFSFSFS